MTSEDQRERENMMIKDLTIKPLGKDMTYREGKVYCKLWDTEIDVALYDEDVKPKIDIRDWNERHDRMSRGITLTEEQGEKLVKSLGQRMLDKQKARSERDPYER